MHLAPGALLCLGFLLLAPVVIRAGGSSYLALLLCIPLILVPFEGGVLLLEARRLGRGWRSLAAPLRKPGLSISGLALTVAVLYLFSMAATLPAAPAGTAMLDAARRWLPPWAIVAEVPQNPSPYTLCLGLLLSGFAAPLAEELYFRGFLMPRIPAAGVWAPAVNAALFSLYHFFSPWNYGAIFAAFLPLVYYVRRRGHLLPVILTHSLFNSLWILAAFARLLRP